MDISQTKLMFFEIVKGLFQNLLKKTRKVLTSGAFNIFGANITSKILNINMWESFESLPKVKEVLGWSWNWKLTTGEIETTRQDKKLAFLLSCRLVSTNRLVLHHIFDFLPFGDLKTSRLVCRGWENVSEHMFENRAKVLISSYGRRAENFLEDFNHCVLNINKYEFVSCNIASSLLANILNSEIHRISSLTLRNIALFDKGKELREFDLRLLIGENIKSLSIDCSTLKTKMIIAQRNLSSVQYLHLHTCKLILAAGVTKFTPESVHFHNMTFCRSNGRDIFAYPLLWPFYVIEYDWLSVLEVTTFTQRFLLCVNWDDMLGPCLSLTLTNFNFSQAPWIKNIVLSKLTIRGVTLGFNWSLLPETLETLVIDDVYPALPNPPPGFLPNLKELNFVCKYWNNPRNNPSFFSHFSSHTSLTKVKLQCDYSSFSRNSCKLNWIPRSVKELHLQQINVIWTDEDFQRDLESLTLINYPLSEIFTILKQFKTENLLAVISDYPIKNIFMKIFFRVRVWQLLRLPINNISIKGLD